MRFFPAMNGTSRAMAAKLGVDALALFVVSGMLYLLSEFVLPGIFSSRVNFFLFFLVASALILLAALPGRAGDDTTSTALVPRGGRVGLALVATVFVFWGEKKLPLPALIGSAIVLLAVLLALFSDLLGTWKETSRMETDRVPDPKTPDTTI